MELALLIGVLFLLLIMGLPVAFALGIASLMTFYVLDIPLIVYLYLRGRGRGRAC